MFSNELELISLGRNVTEGKGSLLIGMGAATAFAPNGTLVAIAQERVKGKLQVAFIEKNGLRHGDFDIRTPEISEKNKNEGYVSWVINDLHWDVTSSILCVGLGAIKGKGDNGNGVVLDVDTMHGRKSPPPPAPGVVQFYSRGNYHWYVNM